MSCMEVCTRWPPPHAESHKHTQTHTDIAQDSKSQTHTKNEKSKRTINRDNKGLGWRMVFSVYLYQNGNNVDQTNTTRLSCWDICLFEGRGLLSRNIQTLSSHTRHWSVVSVVFGGADLLFDEKGSAFLPNSNDIVRGFWFWSEIACVVNVVKDFPNTSASSHCPSSVSLHSTIHHQTTRLFKVQVLYWQQTSQYKWT